MAVNYSVYPGLVWRVKARVGDQVGVGSGCQVEAGAKVCVRMLTNKTSRKKVVDQSKGCVEEMVNATGINCAARLNLE